MIDPYSNTAPPIDPALAEEPVEAVDRGEAGRPEALPISEDIEGVSNAQLEQSLAYWAAAKKANVLTGGEEEGEQFFPYNHAPECLNIPGTEGKKALSTQERRALIERYQKDRASESDENASTSKPELAHIRQIAEVALIQGFADVVLFQKSVKAELEAACQPLLLDAVNAGGTPTEMREMRARVMELSEVHTDFMKYASLTNGLIKVYLEKYDDQEGSAFIDTLNQQLYKEIGLRNDPANEGGERFEFMAIAEREMKSISYTDLLVDIDRMIELQNKVDQHGSGDQVDGGAQAETDHSQLVQARAEVTTKVRLMTETGTTERTSEQGASVQQTPNAQSADDVGTMEGMNAPPTE